MISRRKTIVVASEAWPVRCAGSRTHKEAFHRWAINTDRDRTVDLAEAKKAASDVFDKLDTDKDGTLNIKELQGRLSRKDFIGADRDNDQTLSKDEYLAVVEQRFKSADADGDGSVSAAEFATPDRSRSGPAFGLAACTPVDLQR